jgi:hypothetical protein
MNEESTSADLSPFTSSFCLPNIALLESQPDTPFLGQLKTLLTGPELPVASDVAVPWASPTSSNS